MHSSHDDLRISAILGMPDDMSVDLTVLVNPVRIPVRVIRPNLPGMIFPSGLPV
jgi:hypothetical protein